MVFEQINKIKGKIMAKEHKGKKIELPPNVNYLELVNKSIEAALADLKGNGLNSTEEASLRQLASHPALKELLAAAFEIAAKDGLYENEVADIFGDTNDLIYKASKDEKFKALIANPAAPQFKLSLPTVLAIKSLTSAQQDELWKNLSGLHPDVGQQILATFKTVGRELLPIFKAVSAALLKIGAGLLTSMVHEKVGGQTGNVLSTGINDVTKTLEKTVLAPDVHTEENPAHTAETTVTGDVEHHSTNV